MFRHDDLGTPILFIVLTGLVTDFRQDEDLLMLLLFIFLARQVDRK